VTSTADAHGVAIVWDVAGAELVTVQRRAEGGAWTAQADVAADGTGRVRWTDEAVEPGGRYGYRLALGPGGSEPFAGEVWVDVPRGLRLSIAGFTPNPGGAGASIVFTLASRERATLELVDLAGRRVFAREVGALGPGTHALAIGQALAPGVYWLRVTQGGEQVRTRGVMIR
jgi:hypothetical protein